MWRSLHRILHSRPQQHYSDAECQSFVTSFNTFFISKIANIHQSIAKTLASSSTSSFPPRQLSGTSLSTLPPVSPIKVLKAIRALPNKTSPLDPLPTSTLKRYSPILSSILSKLANLSFSTGVRDLTFVIFFFMRGGMCVRDEAVSCVLIVCVGPRDSVIGCVLHVNARGSLGVYIWRRSARQETNPPNHLVMKWTLIKHTHTRQESVCMERLEFVGAVRVGVESENCWSDWSRVGVELWELLRVIGVCLELRAVGIELLRSWWYWCRVSARRRQTIVVSASVRVVCVEIRSLYFSCDLLIVLLLFSLFPIHFYFEKRVGFRSLTTKRDSFPTGGIRTWQLVSSPPPSRALKSSPY